MNKNYECKHNAQGLRSLATLSCVMSFIFNFLFPDKVAVTKTLSSAEVAGLVVGLLLAALIVICLMVWLYMYRERQKHVTKRGLVSG